MDGTKSRWRVTPQVTSKLEKCFQSTAYPDRDTRLKIAAMLDATVSKTDLDD